MISHLSPKGFIPLAFRAPTARAEQQQRQAENPVDEQPQQVEGASRADDRAECDSQTPFPRLLEQVEIDVVGG